MLRIKVRSSSQRQTLHPMSLRWCPEMGTGWWENPRVKEQLGSKTGCRLCNHRFPDVSSSVHLNYSHHHCFFPPFNKTNSLLSISFKFFFFGSKWKYFAYNSTHSAQLLLSHTGSPMTDSLAPCTTRLFPLVAIVLGLH